MVNPFGNKELLTSAYVRNILQYRIVRNVYPHMTLGELVGALGLRGTRPARSGPAATPFAHP